LSGLATYQAQYGTDTAKMSLVEEILVANSEEPSSRKGAMWLSLWWCLPSLLGFVAFLFSFPIDRQIPFWPHQSIAEIFVQWFLFVTPVTTAIAIITLIKRRRAIEMTLGIKLLSWTAVAVSLATNAIVLLGMSA
jgi:hypothetical protein